MATFNIVILISGRGSNMQAIIDRALSGDLPVTIKAIISNRPDAPGLALASKHGINTKVVNHENFPDKQGFETALSTCINEYQPKLIALAGFMRVLSSDFVGQYKNRMINIHPSLLPQFPGLNTHQRAITAGAREHGASVHFVTSDIDSGPIIIQRSVPIDAADTPETLASKVLAQEHQIYPLAIKWFAQSRLQVQAGCVLLDGKIQPQQGLKNDVYKQNN